MGDGAQKSPAVAGLYLFTLSLRAEGSPVIFLTKAMNIASGKLLAYSDVLVRL